MNTIDISFVRIYLTEGEGCMEGLLKRLHDEEKVQGRDRVSRHQRIRKIGRNAFFLAAGPVAGPAGRH